MRLTVAWSLESMQSHASANGSLPSPSGKPGQQPGAAPLASACATRQLSGQSPLASMHWPSVPRVEAREADVPVMGNGASGKTAWKSARYRSEISQATRKRELLVETRPSVAASAGALSESTQPNQNNTKKKAAFSACCALTSN